MNLDVKIPSVGESITSGLLSTWHKNDGDTVAVGDVLLTLETDKVSTEIQAEKAGTLRIKAAAGSEVKIGEVVATIEEGGAAAAAVAEEKPKASGKKKSAEKPEAKLSTPEPPAPIPPPAPAEEDKSEIGNQKSEIPEGRSTRKKTFPAPPQNRRATRDGAAHRRDPDDV